MFDNLAKAGRSIYSDSARSDRNRRRIIGQIIYNQKCEGRKDIDAEEEEGEEDISSVDNERRKCMHTTLSIRRGKKI